MEHDLDSLLKILEPDYNPDYWSDVIRPQAASLLDGLSADEWDRLLDVWRSKPSSWSIRLVDASLLSEKPRATAFLVTMLKHPSADVGAAAAEMLLEKNYQWTPTESLLSDLNRHLGHATDAQAEPIRRLLSRLPA